MKLVKTRNRTIPLLPRHKIYLSAPVEDGKRLADLFNRVWKSHRPTRATDNSQALEAGIGGQDRYAHRGSRTCERMV